MKEPYTQRKQTLATGRLVFAFLVLAMMEVTVLAVQGAENVFTQQPTNPASVDGLKQAPESHLTLEPNKPIQREIALNETHSYRIVLVEGQYLNLIVDQREADVEIRWFGPDGRRLGELRRLMTPIPTPISMLAAATGEHRVQVTHVKVPLSTKTGTRLYEIKISELRPATPEDVSRLTARSVYLEGINLFLQGTPESAQRAFEKFEETLRRFRVAGDRRGEAHALSDLSGILKTTAAQRAIDYSNQAFTLWRGLGEVRAQISSLHRSGEIYKVLGKLDEELRCYTEALALSRTTHDRGSELTTLVYLRSFYLRVGDKQKAELIKIEIDPLSRAFGEDKRSDFGAARASALQKTREAAELLKLGTLQSRQRAAELYDAALQLYRSDGDRGGEGQILISLGGVVVLLGDKKKAFEFVELAMLYAKAPSKTPFEAFYSHQLLYSVAEIYENFGEKLKAIDVYGLIVGRLPASNVSNVADLHLSISRNYDSLGNKDKALEYLNRTLALWIDVPDYGDSRKAEVLGRIAKIESDRGNLMQSLAQIEAALENIEHRRTKIVSHDLRASYFASSRSYYEFYIDLLMRLNKEHESDGYAIRALQASERARARSLNEALAEAHTNIRNGIDPLLLERRKKLQEQLNANAATDAFSNVNQREDANRERWELTTAYHQVEALIRQNNPQYAALTQPAPLSLAEIQRSLDSDTVLLEYSLGTDRSYLWLVTSTTFAVFELPPQLIIEDQVRSVVTLFNDGKQWAINNQPASKYDTVAARLSQMLFPESAKQVFGKRLLIVPDGGLQYLAFGALPNLNLKNPGMNGARPLIADYEIVTIPSVSTLAMIRSESKRRPAATKNVVVLADPVFDPSDERVKANLDGAISPAPTNDFAANVSNKPVSELQRSVSEVFGAGSSNNTKIRIARLPFSREEANAISTNAPPGDAIKAVDFQANRPAATGQMVARARIVHFATHGLLNNEHPELSGIILSLVDQKGEPIDGFLRLHEIYNLKLSADLVVLSACQTALGKEIRGEGLVGLTRGFMYAGAPRVVASLWKVDDVSTAELMKIFYRKMLRERKPAAAALREAQLEMWRSKRWQPPYYWAAFQLQGDWK